MKRIDYIAFAIIFALAFVSNAWGDPITLRIQNPTENVDGSTIDYRLTNRIHYGKISGSLDTTRDIPGDSAAGSILSYTVDLACGLWYFRADVANPDGERSALSNVVQKGEACPAGDPRAPIMLGDAGAPIYEFTSPPFDGTIAGAAIIQDRPEFSLADGRYELTINPNEILAASRGLVSRDANGSHAGHLTFYLVGTSIRMRIQAEGVNVQLESPPGSIQSGVESVIIGSFGALGVSLTINGTAVSSNQNFTTGTNGNAEPLVIGAAAHSSTEGNADNLSQPFAGQIGLRIYEGQ